MHLFASLARGEGDGLSDIDQLTQLFQRGIDGRHEMSPIASLIVREIIN